MNGLIIFTIIATVATGPFVAVHIGGKAFDHDKPKSLCTDETISIPRVRAKIKRDAY